MNDRFKFRQWDKNTKMMGYYNCNENPLHTLMIPCGKNIMQSTGLKDKNGKLIYEGDILEENWHKYILEWANGAYVIKDIKRKTSYMFTSGICIHKSEVIGNIFENKELLNEN